MSPSVNKEQSYQSFRSKRVFAKELHIVPSLIKAQCNMEMIKIVLFLFVQNSLVIGASIGMFVIANHIILKRDMPPLTGEHSILNLQPGLSVLPRPDSLTSLIRFRLAQRQTYGSYVHDLLSFIHGYERHTQGSRLTDCTKFVAYLDHPKYSCKFSLDLGNKGCSLSGSAYGFDVGCPCFLIKLNRIFGWIPDFNPALTNTSTELGFPTIKIKCEGVTDFDKENIGKICYYDEENTIKYQSDSSGESDCSLNYGQIRNYYFPYKKQRSYQNPFVWVKLLELKRHVAVMLQCWAIAGNIMVDFHHGLGSVQFEIMID